MYAGTIVQESRCETRERDFIISIQWNLKFLICVGFES